MTFLHRDPEQRESLDCLDALTRPSYPHPGFAEERIGACRLTAHPLNDGSLLRSGNDGVYQAPSWYGIADIPDKFGLPSGPEGRYCMEMTILSATDLTPSCLTTGFLLRLSCQVDQGPAFELALPLIVSRKVVEQRVSLTRLAIEYLQTRGLDEWPNLMLDTRRQDLSRFDSTEPALPLTVLLGGAEQTARSVVEELLQQREQQGEAGTW
jgi:hypothetical protein